MENDPWWIFFAGSIPKGRERDLDRVAIRWALPLVNMFYSRKRSIDDSFYCI